MRKSRRIGAGLIVSALVLTGCSGGPAGTNVAQDSKAPLELWTRTTPGQAGEAATKRLAEAFEKATGFKVQVTAIFDDFETKLAQRAAQRDLPDIVMNDVAQLGTMKSQGLLREVDLTKLKNAPDVIEQGLNATKTPDGKQYGLPFSAQAAALLIRKDWREKLGLPVPQDWAGIASLAKAFTTQDPDGNGKNDTAGLVATMSTKRGYASWYFSNFLWAAGGDFISKQGDGKYKPAMSTPESAAAVQWFRDLGCKDNVLQPGSVSMATPATNDLFEAGKGGMYVVASYLLSRFDKSLGKDKYEVVPMPKGAKNADVLAEGNGTYLMAGSPNQAGQDAFADFSISPEGQKIGMEGDAGPIVQLPVNKKVDIAQQRPDARWKTYNDIYTTSGHYVPSIPNWTPVRQDTADTISSLIADCKLDTKAELSKLDTKLAETLRQQGIGAS
ncbi:multiple sugar transport system substrate-binding protein [Amycolatopsis xylanica]|uniref:Multiple sugar transport system substrate-binding protein n=1 Tax=Amycolatopsis xylanica TaxID=589385 RepID=A0A1H2TU77_9PSEU|nr:sugar ABC transporter substrate-binding protein [Amycolatopsis xylanica]SDW47400.1 multiple sugar transport system substrate-binding protein [Amycolatopsis xylanica]